MIGCIKDYFDLRFCERLRLILRPKKKSYAFYMVLSGQVARLSQSAVTQYLLKQIMVEKKVVQIDQDPSIQETKLEYDEYMEQDILRLCNSDILKEGEFFGGIGSTILCPDIPFDTQDNGIREYYLSITGAQLIALTSEKLEDMRESARDYYDIIAHNYSQSTEQLRNTLKNWDNPKRTLSLYSIPSAAHPAVPQVQELRGRLGKVRNRRRPPTSSPQATQRQDREMRATR